MSLLLLAYQVYIDTLVEVNNPLEKYRKRDGWNNTKIYLLILLPHLVIASVHRQKNICSHSEDPLTAFC